MSSTVTERQHREADGPLNSHIEQDKTTTTSRDPSNVSKSQRSTTTYNHAPITAQQLIPNVSKQQLSLLLPIVLAVALAIALLAYRGHLFSHPKTWQDHVQEGAQNLGAGLKDGLNQAYDAATKVGGKQAGLAKQKAAEAAEYAKQKGGEHAAYAYEKAGEGAEYAKQKAGEGAEYAKQKAAEAAAAAGGYAGDAYQRTKDAAADAYDSAKETVLPHPTLLGKASEYVHDKASQLYDRVKHTGHKTQEELKHEANILAENARHAAAQMGNVAEEKYDNVKASAHDTKREVKSKMGY